MARMFVEGQVEASETARSAFARLMKSLDDAAAQDGHRVDGDVSIYEIQQGLITRPQIRLEANVTPAV